MEMELYDCGKAVGKLTLEKTGLYQTVRCVCQPESGGILRVFVWKGTEGACLGVLVPEGMDFALQKRVSKAGLPFVPELAVIGCADDGFWPWRGEFDGVQIDDGYLQKTPEGELLAVPFSEGMEYPFVHRLQQTEQRVICGRDCIVLRPDTASAEEEYEELPAENHTQAQPPSEDFSELPSHEPAPVQAPLPIPDQPAFADEPYTRFHTGTNNIM